MPEYSSSLRMTSDVTEATSSARPSATSMLAMLPIFASTFARSLSRSSARRSASRVGRRASNAARSTPPLSTNASRSSKAKPAQEALQRVEHRELLEALSRCTGDRLQGEVLLAAGLTATDLHSNTCRTSVRPARACGQCPATRNNDEG